MVTKKEVAVNKALDILRQSVPNNYDEAIDWVRPFSQNPLELTNVIEKRCKSNNVTVMPVSSYTKTSKVVSVTPANYVDKYLGNVKGFEIRGNVELHPIGKEIFNRGYTVEGSPRGFAIGINSMKGVELRRQYVRAQENQKVAEEVRIDSAPFRKLLYEFEIKIMKLSVQYLGDENRIDTVISYFNNHKTSKIRTGISYDTFIFRNTENEIDRDKTRDAVWKVMQIIRKGISKLLDWALRNKEKILIGDLIPVFRWHLAIMGMRQRPGDLVFKMTDSFLELTEGIYRTRWVTGLFIVSHWWIVYTEDEVHALEGEYIQGLIKICSFKIISPMVEGGAVWDKLKELMNKFENYLVDGVGWETICGNLLSPIGCIFFGFVVLSSGISFTTITGITALALVTQHYVVNGDLDLEVVSLFGDDEFMFGKKVGEIKGILEGEKFANKYKVYLGISLILDEVPNFKVHRDSADRAIGSRLFGIEGITRYDKVDQQRRIATYIMYGFTDIIKATDLISGYAGGGYLEEYIEEAIIELPNHIQDELIIFDEQNFERYWDWKFAT